jgi:hypothetical protein
VQVYPTGFNDSFPYPSFNVKDLHTVDEGVIEHLLPAVRSGMARQAAARGHGGGGGGGSGSTGTMVVGHYLGARPRTVHGHRMRTDRVYSVLG